jgi:hypothetical protein
VILIVSFISLESFSIVDITSFAVFTLTGCLIVIPIFYLLTLKYLGNKINSIKKFIWYPALLILIANLPVYFMIWLKTNDLYGKNEAFLFLYAFITTAFVFGISLAWKSNIMAKS